MVDFIKKLYSFYLSSSAVTTDSRHVPENSLFFALKGENFDGNQYAQQAIQKGARYVVIDDPKMKIDKRYILVDDVLTTLQQLARYHRRQFDIPVLAISGSNGKTTTKELVRDVLSRKYLVHATKGNLNNHIGVPLTLLSMAHDTEFAVIEMGASGPHEIENLCEIAQPNYGLITNIGHAHLEGFGGLEGVKKGKGELYDYLAKNGGVAFYNVDEPYLWDMAKKVSIRVGYGEVRPDRHDGFIQVDQVPNTEHVVALVQEVGWSYRIFSRISGEHNFENIKTATAIGRYFKLPFTDIKYALESFMPKNMRSQTFELGANLVFLDAYNANPTSMKLALKSFDKMKSDKKQKIAVLGDMLELGSFSKELHREILESVAKMDFDQVCLVGDLFCEVDEKMNGVHFEHVDDLIDWLAQKRIENTFFFVKGSRGIRLEKAFLSDSAKSI